MIIKQIGVIGSGLMGTSIVAYLSIFSHIEKIFWKLSSKSIVDDNLSTLKKEIRFLSRKYNYSFDIAISKILIIQNYIEMKSSNLIIEAVSEDIDVKCEVFLELDKIVNEGMILASNTSSLSITKLASYVKYPEKVIGIHFFNPVKILELVEIISGFNTSAEAIEIGVDFASSINKKPVVVNESPGFIVNRMIIPMINEAISIFSEGVASKEEIDKAMIFGANHPMGPLALSDLIGNDVVLAIMNSLHAETGDSKYRAHPLLIKMVRGKALGKKTKKGFYEYK